MASSISNSNPNSDLFSAKSCKVFHLNPHPWQERVGATILDAVSKKESIRYLCVRPTGGGKSLVFKVLACILKKVTLCICPLLSLGADQTKKTMLNSEGADSSQITSFHLDELKKVTLNKLRRFITHPQAQSTDMVMFASPQSLVDSKHGNDFLTFLITRKLISLIVFDEIHLVTHFGNTIREEFGKLKDQLYLKLTYPVPSLFLTATCTVSIYKGLEKLLDITLNAYHWPLAKEVPHKFVLF